MKRTRWILAALFALTLPVAAQNTFRANGLKNEKNVLGYIISPDSMVLNRTFSEWHVEWQQWAYSIPDSNHPLFDNGDCSVGQSGPVWFLGGKFCPNGAACAYRPILRNCRIPADKALYFPIVNYEDSALEESLAENPGNPKFQQISALRATVDSVLANATVSCEIDGVAIPNLQERFRVRSEAFGFTLPANNVFTSFYGIRFPEGSAQGSTVRVRYNLEVVK